MRYAIIIFKFFALYIAAACLGGLPTVIGQTIVPININANTRWTKANSPYLVKSASFIARDVLLTIEAGVEVQFSAPQGIVVSGRVETLGEKNDSVRFVNIFSGNSFKNFRCFHLQEKGSLSLNYTAQWGAYNNQRASFYFVSSEKNVGNINLSHCRFAMNEFIFAGKGGENKLIADESVFQLSKYAIANFSVQASNCHFDSLQSFALFQVGNSEIVNCKFTNIDNRAIEVNAPIIIDNSLFEFNRTAIYSQSIKEKFVVKGNRFVSNNIAVEFAGMVGTIDSIYNNTFCNNVTYNIQQTINNKIKLNLTNNCWCQDDTAAIISKINDPLLVEIFPVHISCRPCKAVIYKDTSSICADSTVKLFGKLEPEMVINWTSAENISPANLSTLVVRPVNDSDTIISKKFIYQISNPVSGCTSKDSITLKVLPRQHAKCRNCLTMALKSNGEICSEKPIDIGWTQENKFWQYKWSPNEDLNNDKIFNPTAVIKNKTQEKLLKKYRVQIMDTAAGCTHVDSVSIIILPRYTIGCEERPLPHPYNVVTPNNDYDNETFFIENLIYYSNIQISIYNKWGMEVYANKNYQNDWSAPQQPDGTYFYHIIIPELNQEMRGNFIITSSQ